MLHETSATGAAEPGSATFGRLIEPSVLHALPYYFPLCIFPLIIAAAYYGGWWLLPPWLFLSAAWALDGVFGQDERNMNPGKAPERRLLVYNLPVWGWAFLWPLTLIFGLWQILAADHLATWEALTLVFILTVEGQTVFVIGHEMIHRRAPWQRRLGEFLLASASYPQYATEHVYIHHAQVGMPSDLGSPRKGESFWRYVPKEILSNFTNSWRVAGEHLERSNLPRWHYKNPFWRYALYMAFWYGFVYWIGGMWAVFVFAFLGLSCAFSMKISNYFQHYGLRRVRLPNGRWERIMPRHSWSADWKFSNWILYNAQRHADHHAQAARPYPLLQALDAGESPQLPGTYADMIRLVPWPKRWFKKMDPLVDQWRKHFYPEIDDWSAYDSPVSAARPDAFDAILEIFAAAPRLARWIERHPQQLDTLQEREFTDLDLPQGFGPDLEFESIARRGLVRLYWTHEFGVQEMKDEIQQIPAADAKETVEVVRSWSNNKAFQVGMHMVRGNLSPSEARVALSNLAEASICSLLSAVVADLVEWRGPLDSAGFAAVFLGDLASREVYPGVTMQILLIHEGLTARECKRLSRGCLRNLDRLAKESLLFCALERDTTACRAVPLSELASLCDDTTSDDCPDLTRARCVYESGATGVDAQFQALRMQVLADWRKNPSDRSTAYNVPEEPGQASVSAFLGVPGGLIDIERAARHVQLTNFDAHFKDPAPTAATLLRDQEQLAQAASFWRDIQGITRLVGDQGFDAAAAPSSVQRLIATACGYEDLAALNTKIAETASGSAAQIEQFFARD